jgi:hypothetical protein
MRLILNYGFSYSYEKFFFANTSEEKKIYNFIKLSLITIKNLEKCFNHFINSLFQRNNEIKTYSRLGKKHLRTNVIICDNKKVKFFFLFLLWMKKLLFETHFISMYPKCYLSRYFINFSVDKI